MKLCTVCWEAREDEREPRNWLSWYYTGERPGEGTHSLEGGPDSGSQIPRRLGSWQSKLVLLFLGFRDSFMVQSRGQEHRLCLPQSVPGLPFTSKGTLGRVILCASVSSSITHG